jgi:sugar phosphate isomerase/epimerase
MKYSFMSFSTPELTLDEMFALAKRLGYDGIEPRTSAKHKHGVEFDATAEYRAECKSKSVTAGIPFSCVATSCTYADPAKTEAMLSDTHQAIDLAADIGAGRIRVFGGVMPQGFAREAAIELVAKSLKSVADHAGERGVSVCMETHDHWCDPNHVAQVMRAVNHPAIAVNWDIMHPVRVAKVTMQQAFDVLKPWIQHIHFHDGKTTDNKLIMVPIGTGEIDHRTAVMLLKGMNYKNYLSGEWIGWEPFETHLPRELAVMKGYEKENAKK